MNRIIYLMNKQVEAGLDVHGKTFAPYSKAYNDFKAGKKDAPPLRPDLALTGQMMADIAVKDARSDGTGSIGHTHPASAELAFYHNISGAGNSRIIREYWGIPITINTDFEAQDLIAKSMIPEPGDFGI